MSAIADPVEFISSLINPDTKQPFKLYPEEAAFLRAALTLDDDGRLPYADLVFSAPKKSRKTLLGALVTLYVTLAMGEPHAEAYCLANNQEQATGRVFQAISRIVKATPALRRVAKLLTDKIEFDDGAVIQALPTDFAGSAGANPTISVFDELWAYVTERDNRLWDEMVPVPTRKVSIRLTVTYAGFEGESKLLEALYKKGLAGEQIDTDLYRADDLLMYWSYDCHAPWQTERWREQMRRQLRPSQYLRMIENRWVTGEETFIPLEWWDRAAVGQQLISDTALTVTLGVDASTKRDSSAIVACSADQQGRVRMVSHRIFTPTPGEPLDLEATLEEALHQYQSRFHVRAVYYDPYQFARSAQTLARAGLKMIEYPQSVPNLTAMGANLFELLKSGNIIAYPDDEIRLAMQRAVAVETPRGWRISKSKASHHIDVVVALAMAALGAVETAGRGEIFGVMLGGALYPDGHMDFTELDSDGDPMWPIGGPAILG